MISRPLKLIRSVFRTLVRAPLARWRRIVAPIPTLRSREAYARWAATYPPIPHNALMKIEQQTMLDLMPPLAGLRVLDLACGTGRYGQLAQNHGAALVVGVDNSPPMLARGVLPALALSEMTALPFPTASFDVVICGLALGHLPPARLPFAMAEVARVLCVGGIFLFSDFHPYLSLNGGQRTFTDATGKTLAVEHYVNLPSEYFTLLKSSLMMITNMSEPRSRLGANDVPAVLVLRGEKPVG